MNDQIKDFVMFGVIKLVFKPLKEQFPGFGAVTLSLLEPVSLSLHVWIYLSFVDRFQYMWKT